MKILVYTAVFGDKDEGPSLLNKHLLPDHDLRFVCVTDNPDLKSSDYEMVRRPLTYSDVTKNARHVKVNGIDGMANYDVTIWHDSSVMVDCAQIQALIKIGVNYTLSTFEHVQHSVYSEARKCIELNKDHPFRVLFQMLYYGVILRYPSRSQLYETTIVVMTKPYFESALKRMWWCHIRWLSRRDQLSFPVALWQTGETIGVLSGTGFNNPYSSYRGHRSYSYKTSNPLLNFNTKMMRKLGIWGVYRLEKYLAKQ